MRLRCFRAGSRVIGNEKMTVLSFIIFLSNIILTITQISIPLTAISIDDYLQEE